jgi:hypothetical protein
VKDGSSQVGIYEDYSVTRLREHYGEIRRRHALALSWRSTGDKDCADFAAMSRKLQVRAHDSICLVNFRKSAKS